MLDRLAAHLPSAITNLSARARGALGIAIVTPVLLIAVLGSVYVGSRPDSGLAACTWLSRTRHLTAADFPRIRARFAQSRYQGLRTAGTAYADLLTALLTARGTDGYEAVWFYQRLSAACAAHGRPLTPAPGKRPSSAIPAGWDPVPYRRAQLSVPGKWQVETPQGFFCQPHAAGMIFAGARPGIPKGTRCSLTASYAWILAAGHIPAGVRHRKPTAVINGIGVYRRPAGPNSILYLVPELGVRIGAHGPLRTKVLATLHRSPLSVVLGNGPASPVPARWAWHQLGGVRFATPRTWHRQRQTRWATCGTGVVPGSLVLIDAIKPPLALPCPFPLPEAEALEAQPGLTAVTGKFAARSLGEHFTQCQLRHRTRICLAAVTGRGGFFSGVLIFSVARPHHHPAAFFLLGLSGSGARARTIFNSITLG